MGCNLISQSQMIDKGNFLISVDFGQGEDIAVKTIWKKGNKYFPPVVLSVETIGRSSSFKTDESRQNYIDSL